jgi:hypothetical protein
MAFSEHKVNKVNKSERLLFFLLKCLLKSYLKYVKNPKFFKIRAESIYTYHPRSEVIPPGVGGRRGCMTATARGRMHQAGRSAQR